MNDEEGSWDHLQGHRLSKPLESDCRRGQAGRKYGVPESTVGTQVPFP